jgi:two-component system, OmpR family, phosphate regulon response regulator PhoB
MKSDSYATITPTVLALSPDAQGCPLVRFDIWRWRAPASGVGEVGDTDLARNEVGRSVLDPEGARILVVDDNETLRTLVAQALESEGYFVIAAESGEAALEVLHFSPPDLCLVDHVMPGMSGAELLRLIRASDDERIRAIPAIGLSAYESGLHELMAAGALAAIRKPVAYGVLLEKVRLALGDEWRSDGHLRPAR